MKKLDRMTLKRNLIIWMDFAKRLEAITMRLWHKDLIPFLPDLQLKGQWRECALIADALAKNETPNHLLVNRITEYPSDHFYTYCIAVWSEMKKEASEQPFRANAGFSILQGKWLTIYFLIGTTLNICVSAMRICLKKHRGIGKSRISDDEWNRLCEGYKQITGEEYKI